MTSMLIPITDKEYFIEVIFMNGFKQLIKVYSSEYNRQHMLKVANDHVELNNRFLPEIFLEVVQRGIKISIEEIPKPQNRKKHILCKFGTGCTSDRCVYDHPDGKAKKQCKFGLTCKYRPTCKYGHDEDDV